MKNKKIWIVLLLLIIMIALLIGLYFYGLTSVSKSNEVVLFTVNKGESKLDIIDELKEAGLIKSKISSSVYVLLNRNLNLQAGEYEVKRNMNTKEILNLFHEGKIKEVENTFRITFVEGKRLPYYASIIAKNTNSSEEDIIALLSDKAYLQELIQKYWFLTEDILKDGIYYPLEGYLFASTYELYNGSSAKDIVSKMLDGMNNILTPLKEEIETSKYSIHEILTMASIVEVEGSTSTDRAGVAGVFYNRLNSGWSLGSDATTYYAAKIDFSERDLKMSEINAVNAYNTRVSQMAGKLPISPICSPSKESIEATLNPEEHDYYYFVADKFGKTYFMKTNSEHVAKIQELKNTGLWYQY